ncbi:MAG: glycosyltransferase family 4 protein [Acidobacteria bacterium]|nr:glycosyltransferase family 4 protein [Acidobacteriota bacterium]MBV9067641.1 glycosyltransferase family 4 protein [Acidobacteriota bacterium]MBV9188249.1 glycosyltransferase family 4 protein [Acidobacteriota bacterium]
MRILILTPRLPWPLIDGGRIAMARLAEGLVDAGADVEILSLNPRKHRAVATPPIPTEVIDIDTSRIIAPAFATGIPFLVARFLSDEFLEALRRTLRRFVPDVVQIESPFLLPYAGVVRGDSNARVVLRSLNVEFRIWEGLARLERNPLRRIAIRRIASSLRKYEVRHLNACDAIVPISADDADDFRRLGATRPVHVVPCGVAVSGPTRDAPIPNSVGFIGSLDFRPNQEAVEWILGELWPRVLERAGDARLSIAGSGVPEWLRQRMSAVDFRGTVDDATAFMNTMSVMIAPLFAGGGMRIKVLEAMALAKPVVATKLGAGGLDVEHGRDILIADDAASFADAVALLLRDSKTAARIGNAARETVRSRYDNDVLAPGLLTFYESL